MNDPHPIRADWQAHMQTAEYLNAVKIHDPAALFIGFVDGWMAGRTRREALRCRGVDDLAQIIREVDGNNSLGAGALAEAIIKRLDEIEAGE